MGVVIEEAGFRDFYDRHFGAIHRYATARIEPGEVHDVVADVFAVAWRRRADMPGGEQERLWLYGVARRVLADHRRSERRRIRLLVRLSTQPLPVDPGDEEALDGERLERAISHLREGDRELLKLLAWDELTRPEAAEVLGCSVNALNIRLHRALRRLSTELDPAPEGSN